VGRLLGLREGTRLGIDADNSCWGIDDGTSDGRNVGVNDGALVRGLLGIIEGRNEEVVDDANNDSAFLELTIEECLPLADGKKLGCELGQLKGPAEGWIVGAQVSLWSGNVVGSKREPEPRDLSGISLDCVFSWIVGELAMLFLPLLNPVDCACGRIFSNWSISPQLASKPLAIRSISSKYNFIEV